MLTWYRQGRRTSPIQTGITSAKCAINGYLYGAFTKKKRIVTAVKAFVRDVIKSWINSENVYGGTASLPKILKLNWSLRQGAVLVAEWSLS